MGCGGRQHDAAWGGAALCLDVAGTVKPFSGGGGTQIRSRPPGCRARISSVAPTTALLCWQLLSRPSADLGRSAASVPAASVCCACGRGSASSWLWEKPRPVCPLGAAVFPQEAWAARSWKEFWKGKLASYALGPWLRRTVGRGWGWDQGPAVWRLVEELLQPTAQVRAGEARWGVTCPPRLMCGRRR